MTGRGPNLNSCGMTTTVCATTDGRDDNRGCDQSECDADDSDCDDIVPVDVVCDDDSCR